MIMLDMRQIRENPDLYKTELPKKHCDTDIDALLALDDRRRALLTETEQLKAERNKASKMIGDAKKKGEDATEAMEATRKLGDDIAALDVQVKETEEQIRTVLLNTPNLPHPDCPEGSSAEHNTVARTWGEPRNLSFNAIDHKTLGEQLGIFDFTRGAKISGSGFPVYRGLGARLERALIQFFLDTLTTQFGFEEVIPPYLVTRQTMTGTGQLPKFEEDMYHCGEDDLFLIPTAEVPVTNLLAGEVLAQSELTKSLCAYSACFRREAGSYGADVRGLLRLHQFNKVEMVQFANPSESDACHEALTGYAEYMLQQLGLPYRVLNLCKGDLGFSAAKCYDLEVWAAVEQKWLECSSVSTFGDYQARRANIRAKIDGKNTFVHTLNGSGLATPRIMVALCDHYQQEDGSLVIPECLRPYMNGLEKIVPPKAL
jgi:seryl-tRNA synthetase